MLRLEHLPSARRESVMTWLTTSLADCGTCGQPVLPTHARRITKDTGMCHLDCKSQRVASEPAEVASAAVDARARRSDWG